MTIGVIGAKGNLDSLRHVQQLLMVSQVHSEEQSDLVGAVKQGSADCFSPLLVCLRFVLRGHNAVHNDSVLKLNMQRSEVDLNSSLEPITLVWWLNCKTSV